jgi:hypothetical protein
MLLFYHRERKNATGREKWKKMSAIDG